MQANVAVEQQVRTVAARFEREFGRPPRWAAAAPGRVNLIGEHTDYNDGFVLPMAIQRQTVLVADRAAADAARRVRLATTFTAGLATFEASATLQPGEPSWSNYVRGVVALGLDQGLDAGGFDAMIDSTVPVGGGLSSSASLEVATATLLEAMTGRPLQPVAKALLCQKAEHDYAGMPCGIMDQFISTMGQADAALLIDCRSHAVRPVPLTDPGVTVLIANTNVKHELTGGEYAQRRSQCQAAARAMGVPALRDAQLPNLLAKRDALDALSFRRARHVISENTRTLQAAEAMAAGDWPGAGKLMVQSHESLRDDFEVSCPELDAMVELAMERAGDGGVFGSRMTGGGFGGCTVSLVRTDAAQAVRDHLQRRYREKTGIEPALFVTRPAPGARVVPL